MQNALLKVEEKHFRCNFFDGEKVFFTFGLIKHNPLSPLKRLNQKKSKKNARIKGKGE